jgi:hypothetical protein
MVQTNKKAIPICKGCAVYGNEFHPVHNFALKGTGKITMGVQYSKAGLFLLFYGKKEQSY